MNKILSMLALVTTLGFGLIGNTFADDAAPVADTTHAAVTPEATPAAVATPAATEAAPAAAVSAAPVLVPNKGDTAWMIVATVLVLMMCVPGLGLFYGGMVRQKNMLSVLMQTFMITCVLGVLWAVYGYSIAFTQGSTPFFGGLDRLFLMGMTPDSTAATYSKGVVIPEYNYMVFHNRSNIQQISNIEK